MKAYIAGPMRGIKDFNFPAFDAAAQMLREQGHEVFNPADRDRNVHGNGFNISPDGDLAGLPQFNLRAALADDLTWICREAEVMYVLDGWEASKGARAEVALAHALGIPVRTIPA